MRQSPMPTEWHVAYTKPRYEKKITDRLHENKIETFLPVVNTIRQWSDRKKKLAVPLFPNYVFVNIKAFDRYKVLKVSGVTKFVSIERTPVIVPDSEIKSIKMLLEDQVSINTEDYYSIGERVRVTKGALMGTEGILIEKRGNHRFLLRLDFIQKAISVDIKTSHLEKI
ncbi:MAG: UpxY family transcription antiterminator [Bacteroidota bacterium]